MLKKVFIAILIVHVCVCCFVPLLAVGESFITDIGDKIVPSGDAQISTVKNEVWTTVRLILQVAALGALLWSGIRYMMASADQKADIKKSLIMIIIGVVIVFGTTIIIDFVTNVANQAMNG